MAIVRSQFYHSGIALLFWLQKIDKCLSTKYDIDLPEMTYLATSLTSKECYDFYNLLSHRRKIRGKVSIYAEKVKSKEISCTSLLTTWLTDPAEASFRSNENIELKLRKIGRKDLAHWILGKISSNLRRRQLENHGIDRQIEESEINKAIVLNRIDEEVVPLSSLENETFMKNNLLSEDKQTTCIFWKAFFSCLIVLFLVTLFLCFYKFVYTKLRCICRRFDNADDKERFHLEQTYGTTSGSDYSSNNSSKKIRDKNNLQENNETRGNTTRESMESLEKFSSITETNDEIYSNAIEEKRALLLSRIDELTNCVKRKKELPLTWKKNGSTKFQTEYSKFLPRSKNSISSIENTRNESKISSIFSKNNNPEKGKIYYRDENMENNSEIKKWNSPDMEERNIRPSKSENFASFSKSKIKKTIDENETFLKEEESTDSKERVKSKWTSCSCNLINKLPGEKTVWNSDNETKESLEVKKKSDKTIFSSKESLAELSETYDELGMLFSQYLKQQSIPCERKYCNVKRTLRNGKTSYHDIKKCRNRRKINFGEKIIISWDRRPACSTGNICKDTYDEYRIMRATKEEREILARSIIERRKYFLQQPCLSPITTKTLTAQKSSDKI